MHGGYMSMFGICKKTMIYEIKNDKMSASL